MQMGVLGEIAEQVKKAFADLVVPSIRSNSLSIVAQVSPAMDVYVVLQVAADLYGPSGMQIDVLGRIFVQVRNPLAALIVPSRRLFLASIDAQVSPATDL
jgi:hypothetical protein